MCEVFRIQESPGRFFALLSRHVSRFLSTETCGGDAPRELSSVRAVLNKNAKMVLLPGWWVTKPQPGADGTSVSPFSLYIHALKKQHGMQQRTEQKDHPHFPPQHRHKPTCLQQRCVKSNRPPHRCLVSLTSCDATFTTKNPSAPLSAEPFPV